MSRGRPLIFFVFSLISPFLLCHEFRLFLAHRPLFLWVLFGPGGALYLGGLRNSHRARCQVSGPARASTSWLSSLIAVSDELVDTSDR